MVTPIDQLNVGLLPMQSMRSSGMNTMRSSLLGPVSNPPATSITPVNIGSQLAAAAQPTALGRVRGALERNLFDPATLRGLASGLLTGPTRTPVSMGRRLTTGLLAGQQMKEAEEERRLKQGLLQREMDLATRKLELDEMELASGGAMRKNLVGEEMFRLPGGDIVQTFADKRSGQRIMVDDTGDFVAIPQGSVPINFAEIPDIQILESSRDKVLEDEAKMRALDSYLSNVEGASQGFKRLMDTLNTRVKTFIDSGELTKEELSTAKGRKKLQGLLGRFRIDIVGGGVMTEQDALRILDALGGDFNSFQNKEVVREIISELRGDIFKGYESNLKTYNAYARSLPLGSVAQTVFEPRDSYSFAPARESNVIEYKRDAQGNLVPQ